MSIIRTIRDSRTALNASQIKDGLLSSDPETFRYLYKTFGSMIVGYVLKNNGTQQDAREMVQTVLMELWLAVREGRYDEQGKLERYLYILTANTWRDELRRRKVRRVEPLDTRLHDSMEEEDSIARAVVKDRQLEALQHCMGLLGEPCREIIRLYHLESVSLQDVAECLQYDYNNLRKRIFDCRKKLKKLVDDFLQKHSSSSLLEKNSHGK
jgi:RNA polymerase sigma factor (sigma-70 family)